MIRAAILLLALGVAGPMSVHAAAPAGSDDTRLRVLPYAAGVPVTLNVMPANPVTILLEPGERVMAADVGDRTAFAVTVSDMADGLFVRASRLGVRSTLKIRTDRRDYDLDLTAVAGTDRYYLVRFAEALPPPPLPLPASPAPDPAVQLVREPGRYRLSGNKELRPSAMSDDGQHTYLQWSADQALPAVFAVDRLGREEMVNAYMRDGWFTIDRVLDHLLFRIDKAKAEARRVTGTTDK